MRSLLFALGHLASLRVVSREALQIRRGDDAQTLEDGSIEFGEVVLSRQEGKYWCEATTDGAKMTIGDSTVSLEAEIRYPINTPSTVTLGDGTTIDLEPGDAPPVDPLVKAMMDAMKMNVKS